MSKTFLISDTHFGHANILNFLKEDGSKLRPNFTDIEQHDEILIKNWNSVVKNGDKVYHLGDIGFKSFSQVQTIFNRLNGTKVLIKGNHDNFKLSQYAQIFKDVRASHQLDKFILTHIPIHPDSLYRWKANIHGHLHHTNVMQTIVYPNEVEVITKQENDSRYFNVSVEHINYTPIDFEIIKKQYANY